MTDTPNISKEAVEALAQDCDNFERMSDSESTLAHLHHDCATALRAMSARIAELEAALRPFAETAGDCIPEKWDDAANNMEWAGMNMDLTAKDWRTAAALISKEPPHDT